MLIRNSLFLACLVGCAPAPTPAPALQLEGPAGDTSFSSGAPDVVAQVALSEHRDILK